MGVNDAILDDWLPAANIVASNKGVSPALALRELLGERGDYILDETVTEFNDAKIIGAKKILRAEIVRRVRNDDGSTITKVVSQDEWDEGWTKTRITFEVDVDDKHPEGEEFLDSKGWLSSDEVARELYKRGLGAVGKRAFIWKGHTEGDEKAQSGYRFLVWLKIMDEVGNASGTTS